jgi:Na+-driven multidrug efflux pump
MPDSDTFRGWCEYLEVALPATAMICAEFWFFELLVIIAGTLSVPIQASQVILISYAELFAMIFYGIQETSSAIIGNCIG